MTKVEVQGKEKLPQVEIGILGGTGLYEIEGLKDIKEVSPETPFGSPSDAIVIGKLGGVGIAFLPRHGRNLGACWPVRAPSLRPTSRRSPSPASGATMPRRTSCGGG